MNNDKFDKALRKFFDELLHETYISDKVQSLPPSQRNKVAKSLGKELHLLIKKYTGIDTRQPVNK